jgi:hypothetical protein
MGMLLSLAPLNHCNATDVAYMLLLLLLAGYLRMSTDICDIKVTPPAAAGCLHVLYELAQ